MIRFLPLLALASHASAQLQPIDGIACQPLKAQARRLAETLQGVGTPLSRAERSRLDEILGMPDGPDAVSAIQELLAPRVLAAVNVNPESRVKVARGPAPAERWRWIRTRCPPSAEERRPRARGGAQRPRNSPDR